MKYRLGFPLWTGFGYKRMFHFQSVAKTHINKQNKKKK